MRRRSFLKSAAALLPVAGLDLNAFAERAGSRTHRRRRMVIACGQGSAGRNALARV